MSNSREKILSKVRQALISKVPVPFEGNTPSDSVFYPAPEELELEFAENFTNLQGKFCYCGSIEELIENLNELATKRKWANVYCVEDKLQQTLGAAGYSNFNAADLKACDASITTCEALIARTGSMLLTSASQSGRTVSVYAPVHICIAYVNQLVYDTRDALKSLRTIYGNSFPSSVTFAAGPSRTADIEKTLVVGVHGPKEVYLFLIDEVSK